MDTTKTQLRIFQRLKKRLNQIGKDSGYTAELLADVLLTDALNQIEEVLAPVGTLPHVRIVRERLGKPVADELEARIERYIAKRDSEGPHLLNEEPVRRRRPG